jgi:hypothetical protein
MSDYAPELDRERTPTPIPDEGRPCVREVEVLEIFGSHSRDDATARTVTVKVGALLMDLLEASRPTGVTVLADCRVLRRLLRELRDHTSRAGWVATVTTLFVFRVFTGALVALKKQVEAWWWLFGLLYLLGSLFLFFVIGEVRAVHGRLHRPGRSRRRLALGQRSESRPFDCLMAFRQQSAWGSGVFGASAACTA